MSDLSRLDLNLLRTLDVLLSEHHVTRAAQRLHLSQPAVSAQLAKLREALDDPLLLPGPRGMQPTARAQALRGPLRDAMETLSRALTPGPSFDPSKSTRTWRIMAADYAECTIVQAALPRLRAQAPLTRLAVIPLAPARISALAEQGEVDLILHTSHDAPAGLRRLPLFTERYVLVARSGHPRLKRRPTAAQFSKLEHLLVSPDGGGFHGVTDDALARLGLRRQVVLSVPHFLFALSLVTSSDLVAMLPERLARNYPGPGLRIIQAPVDVPGYEISMLWHERVHRDPAHQWLRATIAGSV